MLFPKGKAVRMSGKGGVRRSAGALAERRSELSRTSSRHSRSLDGRSDSTGIVDRESHVSSKSSSSVEHPGGGMGKDVSSRREEKVQKLQERAHESVTAFPRVPEEAINR